MNISTLHNNNKDVSSVSLFNGEEGSVKAIRIVKGKELPKHISKTPALLVCVIGEVVFENEHGVKKALIPGDYVNIEPLVNHWIVSKTDSELLLMK